MSRCYRKPHASKLKPAAQAAADYANNEYNNKNAVQTREHQEYKQAYTDLTLAEPLEQTA